jgi:hypothetical protein
MELKLHDLLVYELIKPTKSREATGEIKKIVGSGKIRWKLEETKDFHKRAQYSLETVSEYMTPDIIVTKLKPAAGEASTVIIEVETDEAFDFAQSLRQIKKYRRISPDVRVVIPKEYEKFAPLYANEGFRVWFWKAKRVIECLRCRNQTDVEGPYEPKCSGCGNKSTKHRLIDLKDIEFIEFTS